MPVKLHPEQIEAISKLDTGKILAGDVGSGKTHTALGYFFERECGGKLAANGQEVIFPTSPKDLYVITPAKKRDDLDWQNIAAQFAISTDRESSISGIKLTVDSWNNIKNYKEVKDAFFIFDEQRLVGSGTWARSFLRIAAHNNWIVLSATPGDKWLDYCAIFVANGFYRNRSDFIARHVVYNTYGGYPKVDRYVETNRLIRLRKQILVPMPVQRHTTRRRIEMKALYDHEATRRVFKDRWNIFQDEPVTNASQMFYLLRKILNTDPSRLDIIGEILDEHPRLIIFYNFDPELEILRTLETRFDIPLAEYNGHHHDPVPKSNRWIYLVQYTSGNEAWECTSTDSMVFFSLNYSFRITYQAEGRIDRRNTKYHILHYYYLMSDYWLDKSIRKAHKDKKDFNEKQTGLKF